MQLIWGQEKHIYPLRDSFFEGQPVKIPAAYAEILAAEYGESSLVNTDFENHHFDEEKMEWIPVSLCMYIDWYMTDIGRFCRTFIPARSYYEDMYYKHI